MHGDAGLHRGACGIDEPDLDAHIPVEVGAGVEGGIEHQLSPDQLAGLVLSVEAPLLRDDAEHCIRGGVDHTEGDPRVLRIAGIARAARLDPAGLQSEQQHVAALEPEHDLDRVTFGELGELLLPHANGQPGRPSVWRRLPARRQ